MPASSLFFLSRYGLRGERHYKTATPRELVLVLVVGWLSDRNTCVTGATRIVARSPCSIAAQNLVTDDEVRCSAACASGCVLGLGASVLDVMHGGLGALADCSPDLLDRILSRCRRRRARRGHAENEAGAE